VTSAWTVVSGCAACLRGVAARKRYAQHQHAVAAVAERLTRAARAEDIEAARAAYIDAQNIGNHGDALDAEIHRAICDCLNRAADALWR
jgi:hypothetical protein